MFIIFPRFNNLSLGNFMPLVPPEGLPCNPVIKILGTSTLAGTVAWMGKRVIPLDFQCGFLFSTLSLISIKIAQEIYPKVKENFQIPIIRGSIFCVIAFGIPIAITHQITPLNLIQAGYLTLVAMGARKVFRIFTDRNPFL
jgi:hypothetical protein